MLSDESVARYSETARSPRPLADAAIAIPMIDEFDKKASEPNSLVDGDMELADFSTWGELRSPVKQKLAGGRPGSKGSQYGRVTPNGVDATPAIFSPAIVVGGRYKASGWVRTSGTQGRASDGAGQEIFVESPDADTWTYWEFEFTSGNVNFVLYTQGLTGYVEWDDVKVERLDPVTTQGEQVQVIGGAEKLTSRGFNLGAVADVKYLKLESNKVAGPEATIMLAIRPGALEQNATRYFWDNEDGERFYCFQGSAAASYGISFAAKNVALTTIARAEYENAWQHQGPNVLCFRYKSGDTQAFINGIQVKNSGVTFADPAPTEWFIGTRFNATQGQDGDVKFFAAWNRKLSEIEILELYHWIRSGWNQP